MVAEGIQQAMNLKDHSMQNENVLYMVQNENNSGQQQLTKMRDFIKTLQQQNVPPVPSVTTSPSPYPHQFHQPVANAVMQQQQTNPAYPYPMHPTMPMWQQLFQNVTNIPQQHQDGNCCRKGGGQKHKCQQQQQQQYQYQPITNKYCWTHGGCNHFGPKCHTPAQGHRSDATFQNKMGGSTTNCS
eukprot:2351862-Ditylum_brightwellii.AAC.1